MNLLKIITEPIKFIQKYFKSVVFLTIIIFIIKDQNMNELKQENLYELNLHGPIIQANEIINEINLLKNNDEIKGVLFNINSPGGSVPPSIEIAYAIKELNNIKPVITYASGTITSGSYYASIWSEKIIANPGSLVGSIGVILQGTNISELLAKVGIKTQTIKAGIYKESGTYTRAWTGIEENELKKVIEDTYNMFVEDVSNARKLDKKNHNSFAQAHIFTASQAKKVGLIDEVATISKAKKDIAILSKVEEPIWNKKDQFDTFVDQIFQKTFNKLNMYLGNYTQNLKLK